jgi:plastocyanin
MFKVTALLSAAALSLAACGSSSTSSTTSTSAGSQTTASSGGAYSKATSTTSTTSSTPAASTGAGMTIDAQDNVFKPNIITGKAGSTVKVTVKNSGTRDHNFKIDSQSSANVDLAPGKSGTVSVKIPSSGSVQFYCEYHKALGMTGTVKPA